MTRLLATARTIRELPADRALCTRCGIERTIRPDRVEGDLCRDCLTVERDVHFLELISEGWGVADARERAGIGQNRAYRLASA